MYRSMNGSTMSNLTRYALFRTQGAQIEAFVRKELMFSLNSVYVYLV